MRFVGRLGAVSGYIGVYNCCHGKVISIAYSECVFVALVIERAKRMHLFVICSLFSSASFSTLFHKQHNFWKKKKLLNIIYKVRPKSF